MISVGTAIKNKAKNEENKIKSDNLRGSNGEMSNIAIPICERLNNSFSIKLYCEFQAHQQNVRILYRRGL